MASTRRKPKPWNTDLTTVPANEVMHEDYTDATLRELCSVKFLTTTERLPLWIAAHKSHAPFNDAVWAVEAETKTELMRIDIGDQLLVVKFHTSSGAVLIQGTYMLKWGLHHRDQLIKDVDTLEVGTRALQNASVTFIDDIEEDLAEDATTVVLGHANANASISNIVPIAPEDDLSSPRVRSPRMLDGANSRIALSARRDSITRNLSTASMGAISWPSSTSPYPMLSTSVPIQRAEEKLKPAMQISPLISSTPLTERSIHSQPFTPATSPSQIAMGHISTMDTSYLTSQTDTYTLERNLTYEQSSAANSPAPSVLQTPDTTPANMEVIRGLEDKISTLMAIITDYQEDRNRTDQIYTSEIRRLAAQIESLRDTRENGHPESHPPSVENTAASNVSNHTSAKEHLLISSSLVKLVDESQLKHTKVLCKRGAHPSRMTRIFKAKAKAGERYQSVTLLVGGNRLNRDDPASNVATTADEIMTAAECARAISDEVRIVELPPRLTSDSMIGAIVDLNSEVEQRCTDKGFEFVPTKGSFWLENGCPNRGLIDRKDKIHLTDVGTEMLLECMGMELVNPEDPRRGVMPEQPRPSPSQNSKKQASPPAEPARTVPNGKKKPHSPKKPHQNDPREQPQTRRDNFTPPMGGHTRFYSHSGGGNRNFNGPNHARTQERNQYGQNRNQAEWKQQRKNNNPHRRTAAPTDGPTQGRSLTNAQGNHARSPHGNYATTSMPKPNAPVYQTRERDAPNNNSTQERNSQCQLCANYGHSAASCRSRDQYCYTCGQIGHFSRVCPQ